MSERVGIPRATDITGRIFGRTAIDSDPRPFRRPLRCAGCSTPVTPVSRYPRRDGAWVDGYYRLTNRERAPHDEGCRFDFDAQVGRLIVEHRHAVTKNGDVYELQLPDFDADPSDDDVGDLPNLGGRDRLTVNTLNDHPLVPVLSAAAAIARLIATYEHDPDARARFVARWQGREIPWNDFYFDVTHDARHLARIVESESHPVAVAGNVKFTGRTTRNDADLLELDTEGGVSYPPTGRWIHVRVMRNDPGRLTHDVGERVLGYGAWGQFEPQESKNHYVSLWINDQSLITSYRSDDA